MKIKISEIYSFTNYIRINLFIIEAFVVITAFKEHARENLFLYYYSLLLFLYFIRNVIFTIYWVGTKVRSVFSLKLYIQYFCQK